MITVPKKKWEELQKQLSWLHALKSAGVDNWQGIDYAIEIFNEENGEED